MLQQLPLKGLRFRSPGMRALVGGEGTRSGGGVVGGHGHVKQQRNHHTNLEQQRHYRGSRLGLFFPVPHSSSLHHHEVISLQMRKSSSTSSSGDNGDAGDGHGHGDGHDVDDGSSSSSPPKTKKEHRVVVKKKAATSFIPRKAPVSMTESTRTFFKALLETKPEATGIVLNYHQSSSGEPRMVFSFDFLQGPPGPNDEPVSLEVLEDGVTPKSPADSIHDGIPKLYIHHNAFMKVLGCKLDVDTDTLQLTIYDRDGFVLDPNA